MTQHHTPLRAPCHRELRHPALFTPVSWLKADIRKVKPRFPRRKVTWHAEVPKVRDKGAQYHLVIAESGSVQVWPVIKEVFSICSQASPWLECTHYFLSTPLHKANHFSLWFAQPLFSIHILSLKIVINHFKHYNLLRNGFYRQKGTPLVVWLQASDSVILLRSSKEVASRRGLQRLSDSTPFSVSFLVAGRIHRNPVKCFVFIIWLLSHSS